MNEDTKNLIKDACKRLTGYKRREYQAHITMKYFGESPNKAERVMGWGRECVPYHSKYNSIERCWGISIVLIILADFSFKNLSHATTCLLFLYLNANPGSRVLSIKAFSKAGGVAHHVG